MSDPEVDAPAIWAQPVEYQAGAMRWVHRASDALTLASHPLLASLRREQSGQADIDRSVQQEASSSDATGADLASPYFRGIRTRYEWTADLRDILDFNRTGFIEELTAAANARGDQTESAMIEFMREITDSHGQTVTASDEQDFADVFIDGIEKMEVPFDDEGNPALQIVLHPDDAERLAGREMTDEQNARMESVLARKRKEWDAARTRRNLPGLAD